MGGKISEPGKNLLRSFFSEDAALVLTGYRPSEDKTLASPSDFSEDAALVK